MATKRQVFYSFHFKNDVMRVQQVRNIGMIEDNKPVSPNDWEAVKKKGDAAVEKWIDDNMKYRSCVVVLIGTETADRPWVRYEIEKAWKDKKGLFGIYVHNLKDPNTGTCTRGRNPFNDWTFKQGGREMQIACYDPNPLYPYNAIKDNLEAWVESAITQRQ